MSTCSLKSSTGRFLSENSDSIGPHINESSRTEPSAEDSKPVTLQGPLEIPRKPKPLLALEPEVAPETNGTHVHVTGKRKREGEDESLTNGHVAKKVAGEPTTNGEQEFIVLDGDEDDGEEGAILIDD